MISEDSTQSRLFGRSLWRRLASMQFAIGVLITLGVASIVAIVLGEFFPGDVAGGEVFYLERMGEAKFRVLKILGVFNPSSILAFCQLAEKAVMSHPDKPLVFYLYGHYSTSARNELESINGTMSFLSPTRAIRALGHLADYSEFRISCKMLSL